MLGATGSTCFASPTSAAPAVRRRPRCASDSTIRTGGSPAHRDQPVQHRRHGAQVVIRSRSINAAMRSGQSPSANTILATRRHRRAQTGVQPAT